jgi:hypothetical protein
LGACRGLRERAYVLLAIVVVVVLAVSGLAFYAMLVTKPDIPKAGPRG